ncbi:MULTISPECIES: type II secretion system F family protein [Providencia]|jgi:protein transport protein HofC|uniref:type II secretion system F family protein n=1 Tax=Providencia TaxID=586 RepID=UPI000D3A5E18|nr:MULTISPECIES: type II secretion system F family protein [Providencia]MBG5882900.1 type II secretion system F family protein [Providencia alcalifaciens]
MFVYHYTSLENNSYITDSLVAKNKKQAFLVIIKRGQIPISIKLKSIFILDMENLNYRIHFFHQLHILSSSGISLLKCFQLLKINCHLPFWKNLINQAIDDLEKGIDFIKNLEKHPHIFNSTIISLIVIAEKTGKYDESFLIIKNMLENNQKTSVLIKKALRYPITLVGFSSLLLIIMLVFVIPQFVEIYESFQQELPSITKVVIIISNTLIENIQWILLTLSSTIFLFIKYKSFASKKLSQLMQYFPYINNIIKAKNLNIYFLTLSSTLKSGLPLLECLDCSTKTIVHHKYKKECHEIYHAILRGASLSDAMRNTQFFPKLATQLISLAEESGKLEYFTLYLFKYYSQQYKTITEHRLKNLEPILLLFIAIIICLIMFAMYLPIFKLGSVISGM